jgi:hypothetical protein
MSADGGSVKNTLGSESSCSSGSSTDTTRRKREYGKKDRKIVRILTVLAYVVCVSMAAVLLSTYYVFLWSPDIKVSTTEPPRTQHYTQSVGGYGKRGYHGPLTNTKFAPSFTLSASQAQQWNLKNRVRGQPAYYQHYTIANTKAYQLNQIPTPQPFLMMTKILTTMREGETTTPTTTTTPSPPVRRSIPDLNSNR